MSYKFIYTLRKPCGAGYMFIDIKNVVSLVKDYGAKVVRVQRLTKEESKIFNRKVKK